MTRSVLVALLVWLVLPPPPAPRLGSDADPATVYSAAIDAVYFSPWGRDVVSMGLRRPVRIEVLSEIQPRLESYWPGNYLREWMPEIPVALIAAAPSPAVGSRLVPRDLRGRVPLIRRDPGYDFFRFGHGFGSAMQLVRPAGRIALGPISFGPDERDALLELALLDPEGGSAGFYVWLEAGSDRWAVAGYALSCNESTPTCWPRERSEAPGG
jgi:hypothetical protein